MKKIRLNELSDSARMVFDGIGLEEFVVIEDGSGRPRYGVVAYRSPTNDQRQKTWERLRLLQDKAEASMRKYVKTEDDVMRVILEDD